MPKYSQQGNGGGGPFSNRTYKCFQWKDGKPNDVGALMKLIWRNCTNVVFVKTDMSQLDFMRDS